MNAILAAAQTKLLARMAQRHAQEQPHPVAIDRKHRQLQEAWVITELSKPLYLKILYCADCLYGHAVDVVRDQPNGVNAREAGIISKRRWDAKCPAREYEDLSTL